VVTDLIERPGQMVGLVQVDWPNKIQRRILRKLYDATTPGEPFHEKRLAKRLHMPVQEVRHHLQVLAEIGLVDEA
jgi:DNA-binding GntR family transcriptional regulator